MTSALETFTVTIDGDQIGLGVENHAHLAVQVQGEQSVVIDDVADKIHFPMTARGGKRIKFPYELKLFTDIPADVSTTLSNAAVAGATSITVLSVAGLPRSGGFVQINSQVVAYTAVNTITKVITLAAALTADAAIGDPVSLHDGRSEQIGYYIEIRTPLGGLVQSTFAARPADSTISLTDLTETVVTPKSDQVRLRDETRGYRDDAQAAADSIYIIGTNNDAAVAGRLRNGPLSKQALADELADPASPSHTGLLAAFTRRWQPNTPYTAGDVVLAPDGSMVSRNSTGTSGASFDAAQWTAVLAKSGTIENTALGDQMADGTSPVRVAADDLYAPAMGSPEYMPAEYAQARITAVDLFRSAFTIQSSGTSGYNQFNGMGYMLAGHSTNNLWDAQFVVPDWCTTVNAKLYWFALAAAGANQATFRVAVNGSRRDGGGTIQSPAQPASGDISVNFPASANVVQALAFGPWTVDPLRILTVRVGRLGAVTATDTNTDVDTGIVGVELLLS